MIVDSIRNSWNWARISEAPRIVQYHCLFLRNVLFFTLLYLMQNGIQIKWAASGIVRQQTFHLLNQLVDLRSLPSFAWPTKTFEPDFNRGSQREVFHCCRLDIRSDRRIAQKFETAQRSVILSERGISHTFWAEKYTCRLLACAAVCSLWNAHKSPCKADHVTKHQPTRTTAVQGCCIIRNGDDSEMVTSKITAGAKILALTDEAKTCSHIFGKIVRNLFSATHHSISPLRTNLISIQIQ